MSQKRNEYTFLRPATQVMAELCRLCTDSHNTTCVDRYPFLSFLCNKLELNLNTESKNKKTWFGNSNMSKNIENLDPHAVICNILPFSAFSLRFWTFNILDGYD